jgi:uncharacterized protein YkwD
MSDGFMLRRYHRQTTLVPETGRKRTYTLVILSLFIAGITGTVFLLAGSGILSDENPELSNGMLARINLEREANNLSPVRMDEDLKAQAIAISREVRTVSITPSTVSGTAVPDATNVFVMPKITWMVSGYDSQQAILDMLENRDPLFRNNILNSDYRDVGIAITSDGFHYFIAVNWQ